MEAVNPIIDFWPGIWFTSAPTTIIFLGKVSFQGESHNGWPSFTFIWSKMLETADMPFFVIVNAWAHWEGTLWTWKHSWFFIFKIMFLLVLFFRRIAYQRFFGLRDKPLFSILWKIRTLKHLSSHLAFFLQLRCILVHLFIFRKLCYIALKYQ